MSYTNFVKPELKVVQADINTDIRPSVSTDTTLFTLDSNTFVELPVRRFKYPLHVLNETEVF